MRPAWVRFKGLEYYTIEKWLTWWCSAKIFSTIMFCLGKTIKTMVFSILMGLCPQCKHVYIRQSQTGCVWVLES